METRGPPGPVTDSTSWRGVRAARGGSTIHETLRHLSGDVVLRARVPTGYRHRHPATLGLAAALGEPTHGVRLFGFGLSAAGPSQSHGSRYAGRFPPLQGSLGPGCGPPFRFQARPQHSRPRTDGSSAVWPRPFNFRVSRVWAFGAASSRSRCCPSIGLARATSAYGPRSAAHGRWLPPTGAPHFMDGLMGDTHQPHRRRHLTCHPLDK